MRLQSLVSAVAVAAVVLASSGCKKGRGDTVVGSCDEPKKPNESSSTHTCSDYFDAKLLKSVCTSPGSKVLTTPCDRKGAVGACRSKYTDNWRYTDDALYPDPQALSELCKSDPVILPTGAIFTPRGAGAVNADKAKENMAKYGAKAKASVATVATIAKKLPAPTGKVNLEGLKGGAIVVHAEDLADPEHPKAIPYRLADTDNIASCSRLIGGRGTLQDNGTALYSCSQYPVLAVVSVTSLKKPASVGTTQSGNTKTTLYSKGRITGDVLLFRTDNAKYLGSFGFDAENETLPVFATVEKIEAELYHQFAVTLTGRAHTAIPGLISSFSLATSP